MLYIILFKLSVNTTVTNFADHHDYRLQKPCDKISQTATALS